MTAVPARPRPPDALPADSRALFDAAVTGFVLIDLDGRIIDANPAGCRLLGEAQADLVGLPWRLVNADAHGQADDDRIKLLTGRLTGVRRTARLRCPDGGFTVATLDLSLLTDSDGRPTAFLAQLSDRGPAGAEEPAAAAACTERAPDHELLDVAANLVSRHRADGWCLSATAAARSLLGREPVEIVGRSIYDCVHRDDLTEVRRSLQHALTTGEVAAATWRPRRPDGKTLWLQTVFTAIGPAEAVAVTHDVTELVDSLHSLAISESRFRSLFEATPLALGVTVAGRFLQINQRLCTLTGWPAEQLANMHVSDLVHPDDVPAAEYERRRLRRGEIELARYDARILRPDGSTTWMQVSSALVPLGDGSTGQLFHLEDVTLVRQNETALATAAAQDPLTDLGNRRYVLNALQSALGRAARNGRPLGVLYCDLDGFKAVNDGFGHAAGDDTLIVIARRLEGCLRAGDLAGRIGGDEFLIVCEDLIGQADLERLAERIRSEISRPLDVRGRQLSIGVSVGVYLTAGGQDADTVLHEADQAMYRDKRRHQLAPGDEASA